MEKGIKQIKKSAVVQNPGGPKKTTFFTSSIIYGVKENLGIYMIRL